MSASTNFDAQRIAALRPHAAAWVDRVGLHAAEFLSLVEKDVAAAGTPIQISPAAYAERLRIEAADAAAHFDTLVESGALRIYFAPAGSSDPFAPVPEDDTPSPGRPRRFRLRVVSAPRPRRRKAPLALVEKDH